MLPIRAYLTIKTLKHMLFCIRIIFFTWNYAKEKNVLHLKRFGLICHWHPQGHVARSGSYTTCHLPDCGIFPTDGLDSLETPSYVTCPDIAVTIVPNHLGYLCFFFLMSSEKTQSSACLLSVVIWQHRAAVHVVPPVCRDFALRSMFCLVICFSSIFFCLLPRKSVCGKPMLCH